MYRHRAGETAKLDRQHRQSSQRVDVDRQDRGKEATYPKKSRPQPSLTARQPNGPNVFVSASLA